MTLKNPRIAFWTIIALGTAFLYAAFALFAAVVHAQTSDPAVAAQATDDLIEILMKHKLLGVLMIGYTAVAKLLEVNKTKGWITSGRWLAIISGSVATATAFVDWQLGSGTLEALVLAAFGAVLLVIRSTVGQPKPAPSQSPAPAPAPSPEVA